MAAFKLNMVLFMAIMVASMQFQGSVAQTRHLVGDTMGWTIPPGGAAAYAAWASRQTFTVGDVLLFNFTTGQHNVAQVSQAAYGPCTTTNPISLTAAGPATITLAAAGTHYYICTVGTHCQIGQKLTINVSAAAAPAPTPATPPPAAPVSPPSATPTPTPTTAPAPSPTTPNPGPAPAPGPSTVTPPPSSSPAPSPTESSPPSPPTFGPSPTDSATPSPTGSTTPPPPPPSPSGAAPSFTTVMPVTFLAIALAFFY